VKKYLNIIILSSLFSIGFEAINIFNSPSDLALSGAGIASKELIYNSPAIPKVPSSILSFSTNRWVQNFTGNSFTFSSGQYRLRFNSIGVDDINVYDDIPSESPLDVISSHYLAFGLSKSYKLDNYILGVGSNLQYTQLFTENKFAISFDLGLKKNISDKLRAGILIENLSYNIELPQNSSLGLSIYSEKIQTEILFDYNYSSIHNNGLHLGVINKNKYLTLNFGYSLYESRTTMSSGIKFTIKEKYKFIYSILSLENSNLGLSHYFGLEISI
tara:strand:- start:1025 stop:1843 length:819 start_codon:yes stop_codon:yes gene_type:complete